jgi:hypothetical protein
VHVLPGDEIEHEQHGVHLGPESYEIIFIEGVW